MTKPFNTNLLALAYKVHETAVEKGWWNSYSMAEMIPKTMANIHGEVSEAWEEFRKGNSIHLRYMNGDKPEGFAVELADTIIRILDLCAAFDIDIDSAIQMKMEYNKTRPFRHGGKVA